MRLLFGVPAARARFLLLVFLTLLYLLNTLGLGLLVSTLVSTQQQAMMFSAFALMVPMIYLSGLIFPIENMPAVFQYVSYVIPVRYYGNVLRGIFLRGSGLNVLWPEALGHARRRRPGPGPSDAAVQEEPGLTPCGRRSRPQP